jgi:hypothetical protein
MKITEARLKQIIKEEMELHQQHLEQPDEEGNMARQQLEHIAAYASELAGLLDDNTQLEGWVQSKITLAQDYISKVKHHLEDELGMGGGGCGGAAPISAEPLDGFIIDDDLYALTEE